MDKGLIREVERGYRPLLPEEWVRDRYSYIRRAGPWIHGLAFQPMRSNSYRITNYLGYLYIPDSYHMFPLQEQLMGRHGIEQSFSIHTHRRDIDGIFARMVSDFWPAILEPFTVDVVPEIEKRLRKNTSFSWPDIWGHHTSFISYPYLGTPSILFGS